MRIRDSKYLVSLVKELCKLPNETEWFEFKENNAEPDEIGGYISALSNSASLCGKTNAYLVWGVNNSDHAIVGTVFDVGGARVGNEALENWILRLLAPKIEFCFFTIEIDDKRVVLLEIECAARTPVAFKSVEFVRVGSYKKKLQEFPEKERALWRLFDKTSFEDGIAVERQTPEEILHLLDHSSYFELLNRAPLIEPPLILAELAADRLIKKNESGEWSITNLGAMLFAKNLAWFPKLHRKAVRVVVYKGRDRNVTEREQQGGKGYANGFEGLMDYLIGVTPTREVIENGRRLVSPVYPAIAVRELVVNALVHQDFFVGGAGPMIEIFDDRIEISNPGTPLMTTDRFLDAPPRSRNEGLASLTRCMGICEERGSGIDKVVLATEEFNLPAPLFEERNDSTIAVLFSKTSLTKMTRADRVRACYWHACLKFVSRDDLTNASVRKRFQIEEKNSATASRLIKEAVEDRYIAVVDEQAGKKFMRYKPWWAVLNARGPVSI
jgi:ATP-dependent DNA helicase RecG